MHLKALFNAVCLVGALLIASAFPAIAGDAPAADTFLDQLQGRWKVTGTYNGHPTKHNFKAEWTFRNAYLRFRDVSEEELASGLEEFEVIAYIGYDAAKNRYVCTWLDNSGIADPESVSAATTRVGDSLPFVFKRADGTFHVTLAFDAKAKKWAFTMEKEKAGAVTPVAQLELKQSH